MKSIVAASHAMQARCIVPIINKPAHTYGKDALVWYQESASCLMKVRIIQAKKWLGIEPAYMILLPGALGTIVEDVKQSELASTYNGFGQPVVEQVQLAA